MQPARHPEPTGCRRSIVRAVRTVRSRLRALPGRLVQPRRPLAWQQGFTDALTGIRALPAAA